MSSSVHILDTKDKACNRSTALKGAEEFMAGKEGKEEGENNRTRVKWARKGGDASDSTNIYKRNSFYQEKWRRRTFQSNTTKRVPRSDGWSGGDGKRKVKIDGKRGW